MSARMRVLISVSLALLMVGAPMKAFGNPPVGFVGEGSLGVAATDGGKDAQDPTDGASRGARTYVVDCGSPTADHHAVAIGATPCSQVWLQCDVEVAKAAALPLEKDLLVVTTYRDGSRSRDIECDVPVATQRRQVTGAMARQEAERLLPHPSIGTAPTGHATLVNIETVLWVNTQADRTLGTVTLLGQRVTLRAHVRQVHWDFGDHVSSTTGSPGKAYTAADPCRTAQCPDYYGHTFETTGQVTIAARLTWTGQFRVGAGAWQSIPGTVSAPATGTRVDVKEARGVLVPNPPGS